MYSEVYTTEYLFQLHAVQIGDTPFCCLLRLLCTPDTTCIRKPATPGSYSGTRTLNERKKQNERQRKKREEKGARKKKVRGDKHPEKNTNTVYIYICGKTKVVFNRTKVGCVL